MSSSSDPFSSPEMPPPKAAKAAAGGGNKPMSVERIYQKKTQLEHILLRPDSYIGSVEPVTQAMWVYDGEEAGLVHREVTFVPGLYKIFDEILVNAADNKQRDPSMDTIKVDIDVDKNLIEIYNNGRGIPIVQHKVEKMFVPSLIFGHLLTSSNYNDDEKKVTGGRNGYGAKLCNIFSSKFTVETASKESGQLFKQTWKKNMGVTEDSNIKVFKGNDYTCVRFSPDLAKFKMSSLDRDIVALMSRRAYDVAASTRGVKVLLNGKRLPVKSFKDYIDMILKNKADDDGNPVKLTYESVNARWEVAATTSEKGFQQVSFVNSIATTKGGRHVDYVVDQIVGKVVDIVKKKSSKSGFAIRPFQVKSHLWVFVNCLIENPTFDSQTKENMTLQPKSFGSKCTLSDKFMKSVEKGGLVDSIMSWINFKTQTKLNMKCSARTLSKIKGVPKLEDANNAGTKHGINCTLILTEGDSAKTLAVSGLGVVGRDNYGVFPLKGKILNVRDASRKQILENAEINNIIKIMGLQYKKKYLSSSDLQTLRYGRLMIMTDQDQDGSHIKGLLINFLHTNWPGVLKFPFLEEFITPIVKVRRSKNELAFYSLPEFEEWKANTPDWNKWTTKYYKGLGTSTALEAREYFKDMKRHRILFKYEGAADDNAIEMAFSKKAIEQRKEWLTNGMDERRRRRELGLNELYLYGKATKEVSYHDFVNKELILFSNMDNERSIPSLVDGLKPGSRKVMFACIKRNIVKEIKVAQLAGSVSELSAYHHGEQSLMSTIVNLAQNFVGSNNLNLLMPIGQFGTRLQGGKDAASARYIFTKLSPLTPHIFNKMDENILTFLREDNQRIEPEYYVPIIPMVLVNGADGIGTGWMTKIPNYDVRELIANVRRMIRGEEPLPMMPSFKNFRGTIEALDNHRYAISGEIGVLDDTRLEITELPIRVWTQTYKENVLEVMLHGSEKKEANMMLTDYKEYHTDTTVRFLVTMPPEKLAAAEREGFHKFFKLQTSISNTSMVLFDRNGCLKRYESVEEILREFYAVRLDYYVKRKAFYEGLLDAESKKLNNQARFILEKIDGTLILENKKRAVIINDLKQRKYDPDPVQRWKSCQNNDALMEENAEDSGDDSQADGEQGARGDAASAVDKKSDYDYLMTLHMWHLSEEKKNQLLKQRDDKKRELEILKKKTPAELWIEDLDAFSKELDRVEAKERENELSDNLKAAKKVPAVKSGAAARGRKPVAAEVLPSPNARRIQPNIDPEMRKRLEKYAATSAEPKRSRKKKTDSQDTSTASDGEIKPLSERIGAGAGDKVRKTAATRVPKRPKAVAEKGSKPAKKVPTRNPWSDVSDEADGSSADGSSLDDFQSPPSDVVSRGPRRATASKIGSLRVESDSESDIFSSNEDSDDKNSSAADKANGDVSMTERNKLAASKSGAQNGTDAASRKPPPPPVSQSALFDSLLDENEDDPPKASAAAASIRPALTSRPESGVINLDSDDDDIGGGKSAPPPAKKMSSQATKKPAPKKRARMHSDTDSDSSIGVPSKSRKRAAAAGKKAAAPRKTKAPASSDSDISIDTKQAIEAARSRSGRAKAPVNYKIGSDDDDNDSDY